MAWDGPLKGQTGLPYSDTGARFLRIGNLRRRSIDLDLDDIQYVFPPGDAEAERTQVRPCDVLVSITAYIGAVGLVPQDIGEAYINQHIALVRPRTIVIDPKWLAYCLVSRVGQEQFNLSLYGGAKDGLGLDDVKSVAVLLPPLPEQRAIVDYLDRETAKIDALVAKVRGNIVKLREYRTALISAAVTGKIDVREQG